MWICEYGIKSKRGARSLERLMMHVISLMISFGYRHCAIRWFGKVTFAHGYESGARLVCFTGKDWLLAVES